MLYEQVEWFWQTCQKSSDAGPNLFRSVTEYDEKIDPFFSQKVSFPNMVQWTRRMLVWPPRQNILGFESKMSQKIKRQNFISQLEAQSATFSQNCS